MFSKLADPFREFGLFAGLLYAIDRLFCMVSPRLRLRFHELTVQPVPDKPLLPARLISQLEIREIKRGDPEMDLMPVRPDIMQSRLEQGAICLGAFRTGRFIGYIWFCFRAYEEDEVRCTFVLTPEREAVFDFDLYIFPGHRMGRAFSGIWNGANEFLRSRGIKFSFSRVTRFNLASRRAHKHLGWKLVGRTIFLQAWGVEFMVATVPPYLYLSLSKSKRVRLKLRPDALLQQSSVPHGG
jgi:hypothetical protein